MAACETCWDTAFHISRITGRPQAEVYYELLQAQPTDGSHQGTEEPHDRA